ncbi:MAG: NAD(P)-dependent alcohol dehydrogenase [Actinomycetota bacterium]
MKAIVCKEYGSPDELELVEVEAPVPTDDQVQVRVHAASVNPLDWHRMRGQPYLVRVGAGLTKPKNTGLGADLAGRVEAVGKNVTSVQPGDEVFGMSIRTIAEHVCASEDGLALKPTNMTFEQAAAVPLAGCTALQGLRDQGHIEAGHKVLINGAGGGVGTFAVQLAKWFGADVTAVCSTSKVELVRSLGADHIIDYTETDFTRGQERYDLILDNVGTRSLSDCRRILKPEGTHVLVGAGDARVLGLLFRALRSVWSKRFGRKKVVFFIAKRSKDDFAFLSELMESGKLTPVIDRSYPLSEAAEAIHYLEGGHARGKVVITLAGTGSLTPE